MTGKMMTALVLFGFMTVGMPSSARAQPERSQAGRDRQRSFRQSPAKQKAQLQKLQAAMKQKLDLDEDQQRAIDSHFSSHLTQIDRRISARRRSGPGNQDSLGMKQLREDMAAARKAGDTATSKRLRDEFRSIMRLRQRDGSQSVSHLIGRLDNELDAKQRRIFDELLKTLNISRSESGKRGNLRALWRAVMNPDMRLSSEQRSTVMRLLKEAMASETDARRSGDEPEAKRLVASAREAVFDELSSEQKKKLNMKMGYAANRKPAGASDAKARKRDQSEEDDEPSEQPEDDGD